MRMHQLAAVVDKHAPAVIGVQETKVSDEDFPVADINALGYDVAYHGQKTHYGVALLFKSDPVRLIKGFAGDDDEAQRRFIGAGFKAADGREITFLNGYFPQGENRSHPTKFPAKERFYADLSDHLLANHTPEDLVFVMGDMNIAPVDADIGIGDANRKRWLKDGKTSFLPEEREWLERLNGWGLKDLYRHHYPDVDDLFSWFDYRSRGFEREPRRGLRIDLIMGSEGALAFSQDAGIDYDIRAMEKPSDHCPIWSEVSLEI